MKSFKIFCFLCAVLPTMAQAEIWAYQINGEEVTECNKRPEVTIDEVWINLERATGIEFDISRDGMVIPGYVLQSKNQKAEFIFYPNKHSCEFEREGIAASVKGDRKKLQQLKENMTEEKRLKGMSPADIPQDQKQDWVNFFAGCTNGVLGQKTVLRGVLQKVVNHCDCTARKFIDIEDKKVSQKELDDKITKISLACQKEIQ